MVERADRCQNGFTGWRFNVSGVLVSYSIEMISSADVHCAQVVEHLSEELQVHRDLLTTQRDDRAREIEELRRDVERQRQQLAKYEQNISQLRAIVSDLLRSRSPHNNSVLYHRTTAEPVFPIGTFANLVQKFKNRSRVK